MLDEFVHCLFEGLIGALPAWRYTVSDDSTEHWDFLIVIILLKLYNVDHVIHADLQETDSKVVQCSHPFIFGMQY